jgi:L,D-peptidoglycan transpeptidase YkuD (ErfK/YbiS/YcfS/YnhG family)
MEELMIQNIHKVILFILFITLCFSLTGCITDNSKKTLSENQTQSQDTESNQGESYPEGSNTPEISLIPEVSEIPEITEAPKDTEASGAPIKDDNKLSETAESIGEEFDTGKRAELEFKGTSETVYATSNVNIRSSYSVNENNVISVLKKGSSVKRIGIQKEWSKVLFKDKVCFIKTKYLSKNKPAAEVTATIAPVEEKEEDITNTSSDRDFVEDLDIASNLNQLVVVVGNGGSDCTVSFHTKDSNGIWKQQFSTDGDNGSNGISYNKREGDKKTPAGLYSFTLAFGIKSDPGSLILYRQITKYDYWVDDENSPYYNTLVNVLETPGDFTSEHLIDHNPSYNYAMHINYNPENATGIGSAIFLHCFNGTGRTTGCVAISENYMKKLIQKLDPSAMILIVPDEEDLKNY